MEVQEPDSQREEGHLQLLNHEEVRKDSRESSRWTIQDYTQAEDRRQRWAR